MPLLHLVARPLLSSLFVGAGLDSLRDPGPKAEVAAPFLDRARATLPALPDDDVQLVRLNAAVQVGAGVLLATGKAPRLAALALAGSLVPTTLSAHAFWEHPEGQAREAQQVQFLKNASVMGGLLAVAGAARRRRARKGPSRRCRWAR
ncbi:DoxX family protein [Streptomyces sp. NPDC048172]|uniref:DoxX family protein n=1 Tax=Streptomyces sp. NPDC048172 TaxID=3365505 RepID=UPI003721AAB8